MIQEIKKSSQNGPKFKWFFEKKGSHFLNPAHPTFEDMRLAFNAGVCQSIKPKLGLDTLELWPVNSIPNTWHENYNYNVNQIYSDREIMGLAFNTEIFQSTKPKITIESFESWAVNPTPSAWYERNNDNC